MKKRLTTEEMEQFLIDYGICSEDFLDGAICVGGVNRETFERVLFYHTGYRDFPTFIESELEEEE